MKSITWFNYTLRIFAIFGTFLYLIFAGSILFYPYGVDYGEAPLINQALNITDHKNIYPSSFQNPPYTIANYPPIYPVATSALARFSGLPYYFSGRLISIISALVITIIIYNLGKRLTGSKVLGLFGSIVFLSHPYVMIWSSLARVDLLALAFSLFALYVLLKQGLQYKALLLCAILLFLAIFTRQSYLLAAPITALVLIWRYDRRRAFIFSLILAIFIVAAFILLNWRTESGFYNNIVVANVNEFELSRIISQFLNFFTTWPVMILTTLMILAYLISRWRKSPSELIALDRPNESEFAIIALPVYVICSALTSLTIGKVGSDINYYLEFITASTLLIVFSLHIIHVRSKKIGNLIAVLLSLQLLWCLLIGLMIYLSNVFPHWEKIDQTNALFDQVKEASKSGQVLSDDYLDLVILSGQRIYYQPFEFGQLYKAGLWDARDFASEIENQQFPLILIGGDTIHKDCCWPPPLTEAIEIAYQIRQVSNMAICTPLR